MTHAFLQHPYVRRSVIRRTTALHTALGAICGFRHPLGSWNIFPMNRERGDCCAVCAPTHTHECILFEAALEPQCFLKCTTSEKRSGQDDTESFISINLGKSYIELPYGIKQVSTYLFMFYYVVTKNKVPP